MRLITAAALFVVAPLGAQTPLDTNCAVTRVMIPARDGVKLSTAIMAPQNAGRPLPMLMERTPYGVDGPISCKETAEEYGVPYRQHPTMRQAILHHLILLRQLGNEN